MDIITRVWFALGLAMTGAAAAEVSLQGTVTVSGVGMSGARIEVRGPAVSRDVWAGRDGAWRMDGLPSGHRNRLGREPRLSGRREAGGAVRPKHGRRFP